MSDSTDRGVAPSPPEVDDGVASALGASLAAVTLAATAVPVRTGAGGEVVVAASALALAAVGAFLARRHALLERRVGAAVAALATVSILLLSTYALNQGVTAGVAVPLLGTVPFLLLAVLAAGGAVAAAAADYGGVSGAGIYRRAVATTKFSAVGLVGFLAVQIWMGVLLVFVFLFASGVGSIDDLARTDLTILSQAGTVLGVGCVAAAYLAWSDRGWDFLDLRVPTLRDLGYVVGGFLALFGVLIGLSALMTATGTESSPHSIAEQAEGSPEILLVLIPAAILVIGPFEELLYRNIIQKSMYDYFSRPGAVVAASVPFALAHVSAYGSGTVGQSLVSLGIVLALSLLLGALYERTENLLVPAFVHGLYNAVTFLTLYFELTG